MSINRKIQHRTFPQNTKTQYVQNNIVDFIMAAPGRAYVPGSCRIEGNLLCNLTGTTVKIVANDIYMDKFAGANSLFVNIDTSSTKLGSWESLQNAPRYNKMIYTGMATTADAMNSHNIVELRGPTDDYTKDILNGEKIVGTATHGVTNIQSPTSFSCKPAFCLNQVGATIPGGDNSIQFDSVGSLTVKFRLAINEDVFFGQDAAAANYILSNLSLSFESVPGSAKQAPVMIRTAQLVRQTMQSSFSSMSTNVNGQIGSVAISFLDQAKENDAEYNTLDLDKVPNVSRVEYLFNDNSQKFITFPLETQEEMLSHYLESISDSDNNSFTLGNIKANEGYGLGVSFYQFIDLSSNKFGLNLKSGIASNGAPSSYILFAYFLGAFSIP